MDINIAQKEYDELIKKHSELTDKLHDFENHMFEQGYTIKNNKINKTNVYIEISFMGQTQYEDTGFYKMYREFIPMENDALLSDVLNISQIENEKEREEKANDLLTLIFIENEYNSDICYKYFHKFYNAFDVISRDPSEEIEEIHVDVNYDCTDEMLIDAFFESSYGNWKGYVSFVKSDKDLTKSNIESSFSKFYRYN